MEISRLRDEAVLWIEEKTGLSEASLQAKKALEKAAERQSILQELCSTQKKAISDLKKKVKDHLQERRTQKVKTDKEVSKAEGIAAKLNGEIVVLKQHIHKLQTQKAKSISAVDKLALDNEFLRKEIVQKEGCLLNFAQDGESLRKQIENCTLQSHQLAASCEEWRNRCASLEGEMEKLAQQSKRVETQLEESRAKCGQLEMTAQKEAEEIVQLKVCVGSHEKQEQAIPRLKEHIQQLLTELKEKKIAVNTLENARAMLDENHRGSMEEKNQTLHHLRAEITAFQRNEFRYIERIKSLQKVNAEREHKLVGNEKQLNALKSSLKKQFQKREDILKASAEKILQNSQQKLESKVAEHVCALDQLKQDAIKSKAVFEEKNRVASSRLKETEAKYGVLSKNLNAAKALISELRGTVASRDRAIAELEQELERKTKKLKVLLDASTENETVVQALKADHEKEFEDLCDRHSAKVELVEERLQKCEVAKLELLSECKKLNEEVGHFQNQLGEMQDVVKEKNQSIAELKHDMSQKDEARRSIENQLKAIITSKLGEIKALNQKLIKSIERAERLETQQRQVKAEQISTALQLEDMNRRLKSRSEASENSNRGLHLEIERLTSELTEQTKEKAVLDTKYAKLEEHHATELADVLASLRRKEEEAVKLQETHDSDTEALKELRKEQSSNKALIVKLRKHMDGSFVQQKEVRQEVSAMQALIDTQQNRVQELELEASHRKMLLKEQQESVKEYQAQIEVTRQGKAVLEADLVAKINSLTEMITRKEGDLLAQKQLREKTMVKHEAEVATLKQRDEAFSRKVLEMEQQQQRLKEDYLGKLTEAKSLHLDLEKMRQLDHEKFTDREKEQTASLNLLKQSVQEFQKRIDFLLHEVKDKNSMMESIQRESIKAVNSLRETEAALKSSQAALASATESRQSCEIQHKNKLLDLKRQLEDVKRELRSTVQTKESLTLSLQHLEKDHRLLENQGDIKVSAFQRTITKLEGEQKLKTTEVSVLKQTIEELNREAEETLGAMNSKVFSIREDFEQKVNRLKLENTTKTQRLEKAEQGKEEAVAKLEESVRQREHFQKEERQLHSRVEEIDDTLQQEQVKYKRLAEKKLKLEEVLRKYRLQLSELNSNHADHYNISHQGSSVSTSTLKLPRVRTS